jgi:hypothetical protein
MLPTLAVTGGSELELEEKSVEDEMLKKSAKSSVFYVV